MISKVFVYGTGTMGRGIARSAAEHGYTAIFCNDVFPNEVAENIKAIEKSLERRVNKGKMTAEDKELILQRIVPSTNLEDCKDADFIIETIIEDVSIKQNAFLKLEQFSKPNVVLASNTTSCSITEIASKLKSPERVIGFHYFNPAHIMKLVEIMPSLYTSDEVVKQANEFALAINKTPVITKREAPAGVTSRVLAGLLNEAVWVLHEGVATVDDIDNAMELGCAHKLGPFKLIDLIGVDIHLAKTKMLYAKTGDPRYRPCYLLEQMVTAGYLGKKAGKGFYDYTGETAKPMSFVK